VKQVAVTMRVADRYICQEPYSDLDYDGKQNYAVSPWLRRPGSSCTHVVGRLCLEEHIRRGERYSMRCPIFASSGLASGRPSPRTRSNLMPIC
jgi:hypothetical protein